MVLKADFNAGESGPGSSGREETGVCAERGIERNAGSIPQQPECFIFRVEQVIDAGKQADVVADLIGPMQVDHDITVDFVEQVGFR